MQSLGQYGEASVWDFPVTTSLSVISGCRSISPMLLVVIIASTDRRCSAETETFWILCTCNRMRKVRYDSQPTPTWGYVHVEVYILLPSVIIKSSTLFILHNTATCSPVPGNQFKWSHSQNLWEVYTVRYKNV